MNVGAPTPPRIIVGGVVILIWEIEEWGRNPGVQHLSVLLLQDLVGEDNDVADRLGLVWSCWESKAATPNQSFSVRTLSLCAINLLKEALH